MIDLNPHHLETVRRILAEHVPACEVRAFGSRATWTAKDYSDLDLAIVGAGPLHRGALGRLKDAFEDSDLPIRVDVLDWHAISESFRNAIAQDCVVVQEGATKQTAAGAWRETSLGEVIELKRGYDLPQRKRTPGDIPLVSSSGVTYYHTEAKVRGPGVVTGRYGTLGEVFFVPSDFWPLNTTLYVRDFKGNDPRFISYFLRGLDFSAYSDKAAVPGLNRNHLHRAVVRYPSDIAEQRAIAHVLGTLDDKIELNRRMCETLETMARALFQSWFVDFEPVRAKMEGRWRPGESLPGLPAEHYHLFPDTLVPSALGDIPEGWEVRTLGERFRLTMGQSPPGTTYNNDGEGLPFFQGRTDFGLRYPSNRVFCSAPSRLAQSDDTLVSVRAPVGDVNMAWEESCIGRGVAAIRHLSGSRSFSYYALQTLRAELQQYEQAGTVFGAITGKQFGSMQVVEPPPEVVNCYEILVLPWDDNIRRNVAESRGLTVQRDVLLPRLVSGELRVESSS